MTENHDFLKLWKFLGSFLVSLWVFDTAAEGIAVVFVSVLNVQHSDGTYCIYIFLSRFFNEIAQAGFDSAYRGRLA